MKVMNQLKNQLKKFILIVNKRMKIINVLNMKTVLSIYFECRRLQNVLLLVKLLIKVQIIFINKF